MHAFNVIACGFLAGLVVVPAVVADTAEFESIAGAMGANDITPDGRFIVGPMPDFIHSYRLDTYTGQFLQLGDGFADAMAVSDDGSAIVGDIDDPDLGDEVAGIWTMKTGTWMSLGYLPTAGACPSRSNGYEISADGSVAVGLSWVNGCQARAFRWTQETGMIELGVLANGGNRASVCSADGNLIGGFAQGSFSRTPAIWNAIGEGTLLDSPTGDALGEVHAINDAGTIMLGSWNGQAVKWTAPDWKRTVIGAGSILPGWNGIPQDIADDGTIVGFDFLAGNRRAWIQPKGVGPLIDFKTYVEANGAVVPANMILEVCQAISADGRKIIGHGSGTGAWIITITPGCASDIAPSGGNGVVDVDDLLVVINAWGQGQGNAGDITSNGLVDVDDLLQVINGWGSCPGATGACCTGDGCVQLTASECNSIVGEYLGNSVPCSLTACGFNDSCADAIDVTANINTGVVLGDNSLATPQFGGGDPELPEGSPSCQWLKNPISAHSTVWYSFIAPSSGSVTIETCASGLPFRDSTIGLYAGVCGQLSEIGCDEDGCPDAPEDYWYSQVVASDLTPGERYYFCIMNPGDWNGSVPGPFSFTITAPE